MILSQKEVNQCFDNAFSQFEWEMTGTHKPPYSHWDRLNDTIQKALKNIGVLVPTAIEAVQNIKEFERTLNKIKNEN